MQLSWIRGSLSIKCLYASIAPRCFATAATLLLCIAAPTLVNGAESDAPSRKELINIYLKGAFPISDILFKPKAIPSISYSCDKKACEEVIVVLRSMLPLKDDQLFLANDSRAALIEIKFVEGDISPLRQPKGDTGESTIYWSSIHSSKCSMLSAVRDNVIMKAVIVVSEDEGPRKNLLCIAYELLRGTGFHIKGSYESYVSEYENLTADKLKVALRGLARFTRIHWLESTAPGMTRAETAEILMGQPR